jgi:hypothetical protein
MISGFLYIDPGSGSFVVQVLISAVLTVVFFFRNILHFFRNLFRRSKDNDEGDKHA